MKTIKAINKEIEEIVSKAFPTTRDKNRVAFLRQCVRYLETEPSQEFLDSEKERLKREVQVLENRYDNWLESVPKRKSSPNPYGAYCTEVNMNYHKNQLKTLKYLA